MVSTLAVYSGGPKFNSWSGTGYPDMYFIAFLKSFQANAKHLLKCTVILIHPFTVMLPLDKAMQFRK
jgi:hypothetical protein